MIANKALLYLLSYLYNNSSYSIQQILYCGYVLYKYNLYYEVSFFIVFFFLCVKSYGRFPCTVYRLIERIFCGPPNILYATHCEAKVKYVGTAGKYIFRSPYIIFLYLRDEKYVIKNI